MGQRLNLEIRKKEKVLANAYYHWSAYTQSAFELTAEVVRFISANRSIIKDDKLLAIRALESTGAGIPDWNTESSELQRIHNIRKYSAIEFEPFKDRNEGIISVFPNTIQDTQEWAEGTSIIDIDTLDISFDVFGYYDSVNDIKEWHEDFKEEEAVVFNYDFDHLSLGELSDIVSTVCSDKWANFDGQYLCEIG